MSSVFCYTDVTLTIQDSKPLVEFLVKLDTVISGFENKPFSNTFEQKTFNLLSPNEVKT